MSRPVFCALTTLAALLFATAANAQDPRLGWLEPEIKQGFAELQAGQFDQAVQTLEAFLDQDPEKHVAWFYLGMAQHSAGRLDEALTAHLMTAGLAPKGDQLIPAALYNAACAHALSGRTERAFQYLHRARNLGFGNVTLMGTDTDLDSLRGDERLTAFIANPRIRPPDPKTVVASLTGQLVGGTGGVELAADGTLYIADFTSNVWKLSPEGEMSLLTTGFTKAADCTLDGDGNLLQVDHGTSKVFSVAPDGTRTDLAIAGLSGPVGIDTGADGTLFITNYTSQAIMTVAPDGTVATLSQGGLLSGPNGIAVAPDGTVYVVNYKDGVVLALDEEGSQKLVANLPGKGNGHVAWSHGALFITDRVGHQVYQVTPAGEVSLVSGQGSRGLNDGSGANAQHSLPNGIAVDPTGKHIYVNDKGPTGNSHFVVRRITLP